MPPNGCSDWSSSVGSFLTESSNESDLVCRFGAKKIDEFGREVYSIEKLETNDGGVDLQKLLMEKGLAVRVGDGAIPAATSTTTPRTFQVGFLQDLFPSMVKN